MELKDEIYYLRRWSECAIDLGWVRQSDGDSGQCCSDLQLLGTIGVSCWSSEEGPKRVNCPPSLSTADLKKWVKLGHFHLFRGCDSLRDLVALSGLRGGLRKVE